MPIDSRTTNKRGYRIKKHRHQKTSSASCRSFFYPSQPGTLKTSASSLLTYSGGLLLNLLPPLRGPTLWLKFSTPTPVPIPVTVLLALPSFIGNRLSTTALVVAWRFKGGGPPPPAPMLLLKSSSTGLSSAEEAEDVEDEAGRFITLMSISFRPDLADCSSGIIVVVVWEWN